MIVVTDVILTLYYRVHGSLFNMIVVTNVTLTLYYPWSIARYSI